MQNTAYDSLGQFRNISAMRDVDGCQVGSLVALKRSAGPRLGWSALPCDNARSTGKQAVQQVGGHCG